MNKKYNFIAKLLFFISAILATALLGFGLNAYRQACVFNSAYRPDAGVAVFVAPDTKVAPDVIREKLINMDGVEKTDYFPREKVLEKVQAENSKLKNVILSGENPFSPYYILTPRQVSVVSAQELVEKAKKIEGVEDAVFDENLFSAVEKTAKFSRVYALCGKAALLLVLLIISAKLIIRLLNEKADLLNYLYNLLSGIITGALGAGIFYLFSRKIVHSDVMRLPAKYILYFLLGGVLVVLLWEND